MDLFADPAERDEPNSFVQLLWEQGSGFEKEVIEGLQVPYTDLSTYGADENKKLTLEAMARDDALIYGGRIEADGLLGDPDLLRKEGEGYIAGDIKSASAEEGPKDLSRPKKHYAVQLSLYTDILERKKAFRRQARLYLGYQSPGSHLRLGGVTGGKKSVYALAGLSRLPRRGNCDRRGVRQDPCCI